MLTTDILQETSMCDELLKEARRALEEGCISLQEAYAILIKINTYLEILSTQIDEYENKLISVENKVETMLN